MTYQSKSYRPIEGTGCPLGWRDSPPNWIWISAPNDLIRSAETLLYQLDALRTDDTVFVHGSLKLPSKCECARCVKPFVHTMEIPEWSCILPLEGDDAIEVIGEYADLTPWMREDILLGLPHHPLCDESCRGLVFKQETLPTQRTSKRLIAGALWISGSSNDNL